MRRILIERARQRASLKRGGDRARLELDAIAPAIAPLGCNDILGLDEAGNGEPRLGPASPLKSFRQRWAFSPNRLGDSLADFA